MKLQAQAPPPYSANATSPTPAPAPAPASAPAPAPPAPAPPAPAPPAPALQATAAGAVPLSSMPPMPPGPGPLMPPPPQQQQQQHGLLQVPQQQQAPVQQQQGLFSSIASSIGSMVGIGGSNRGLRPSQRWQMQMKKRQPASRNAGAAASVAAAAPIKVVLGKPDNEEHTVLAMVIDRSGSMQSMGSEVEGGCNSYLDEQRTTDLEDGGATTNVIMTTFDNEVSVLHDNVPLTTVPAVTHEDVRPRGMTALYDAIGETLRRTAACVNAMPTKPSVVVFILTDGHENASAAWTKAAVTKEITKLQTEANWDFYFAAANQDAMQAGSGLGMDTEQCVTFRSAGANMKATMVSTQKAWHRKKCSKGATKGYSSEERAKSMW